MRWQSCCSGGKGQAACSREEKTSPLIYTDPEKNLNSRLRYSGGHGSREEREELRMLRGLFGLCMQGPIRSQIATAMDKKLKTARDC